MAGFPFVVMALLAFFPCGWLGVGGEVPVKVSFSVEYSTGDANHDALLQADKAEVSRGETAFDLHAVLFCDGLVVRFVAVGSLSFLPTDSIWQNNHPCCVFTCSGRLTWSWKVPTVWWAQRPAL